jgi:hypothetical protein
MVQAEPQTSAVVSHTFNSSQKKQKVNRKLQDLVTLPACAFAAVVAPMKLEN